MREKTQETIGAAEINSEELETQSPHIGEINRENARNINKPLFQLSGKRMEEISLEDETITEPNIEEPMGFTGKVREKQLSLEYDDYLFLEYQNWIKNKTYTKAVKKT